MSPNLHLHTVRDVFDNWYCSDDTQRAMLTSWCGYPLPCFEISRTVARLGRMRGCATALTMATVLVSAQVRAYHVDGVDGEVYYGPVWKDVGHPSINNLLESGEYAALGKSARKPQ